MGGSKIDYGILVPGVLLWSTQLVGVAFPDSWWGVHYFAFFSDGWGVALLTLSLLLILTGCIRSWRIGFIQKCSPLLKSPLHPAIVITLVSLGMGVLYYLFPIVNDIYGDAILLKQSLDTRYDEFPEKYLGGLTNFDFSPSGGRRFMLASTVQIMVWTGASYGEALFWICVFCGVCFVVTWLSFVKHYLESGLWKLTFGIIGISGPFMLVYYGHMEFYAISFWVLLCWILAMLICLKKPKVANLAGLTLLLLFAVKVHPTSLLLIPAWLAVLVKRFAKEKWSKRLLSWRGLATAFLLPGAAAGAAVYFFVTRDYNDDRILTDTVDTEHIFLPLFSPDPPLDKYNLFSLYHFFDYFNVVLWWSLPALFLAVVFLMRFRKKIEC